MKKLLFVIVCAIAGNAFADTCPTDVPVKALPPHKVGPYSWTGPIRPLGDPCIGLLKIERKNDRIWYAGGVNGLYVTVDGGTTWKKELSGNVLALHIGHEEGIPFIYAGIDKQLFLSRDHGRHWKLIHTSAFFISSILTVENTLYLGVKFTENAAAGVYRFDLAGQGMRLLRFPDRQFGLIIWTLVHDPIAGLLYAGTEQAKKPDDIANYHPPLFRSNHNLGWTNVAGNEFKGNEKGLPSWHVIELAVRQTDGFVWALTEGLGVHGSADHGDTWTVHTTNNPGVGDTILWDKNHKNRIYIGRNVFGVLTGGIYVSDDGGTTLQQVGLDGTQVSDITTDGFFTTLYVASYSSGIYMSPLPQQ